VGEIVLTMIDTERCGGSRTMYDEAVVDRRDVGFVIPYVDNDPAEAVCGVQLGDGTLQNGETRDIESFKKYLTYSFVCVSSEAGCDRKNNGGLILCASDLQLLEKDVFPGCLRIFKRRVVQGVQRRTILLLLASSLEYRRL